VGDKLKLNEVVVRHLKNFDRRIFEKEAICAVRAETVLMSN